MVDFFVNLLFTTFFYAARNCLILDGKVSLTYAYVAGHLNTMLRASL